MEYVIKRSNGTFFCAGSRFSDEYPDAHVFTSVKNAKVTASELRAKGYFVWVIAHYGLSNEKVVA